MRNVALVYSTIDKASINIANNIRKLTDRIKTYEPHNRIQAQEDVYLVKIEEELVYSDWLESKIEASVVIFLSRHEARAKLPSLTVHAPGNWTSEVKLGGEAKKLTPAPAAYMYKVLEFLYREKAYYGLESWLCSYEATHHGPYFSKLPAFFVEIGSTEDEWVNEKAGELIAQAVIESIRSRWESNDAAIGLGGPHYAPKITRISLKNKLPVGHIAPRYVLDKIEPEMLYYAAERTVENASSVIVDWKGMNKKQRDLFLPYLESRGFKIVRS